MKGRSNKKEFVKKICEVVHKSLTEGVLRVLKESERGGNGS